jgi:hypothetical protein
MNRRWPCLTFTGLLLLVGQVESSWAQLPLLNGSAVESLPELETDRETFTPSTTTTGKNLWIAEWSYTYIDNRDEPDTNSFPELLVRYGISDRVELRLGWNYEVGGGGNVVTPLESSEGLDNGEVESESRMIYGMKAEVTDQRGWVPRSVVILEGFTPTLGNNPASQPVATYACGWLLPNAWRWDSAIRYSQGFDLEDAYNRWAPSTVLRIPASENFQYHLGLFGSFTQGRAIDKDRVFISPGCHYNFTPNLELGLRVGWGLTPDSANFFVNTGFGWRF